MAISKITTSGVATDTLTAADLAPNSVDSSELVDGSIDTSHIGDNQVTLAKMAGGTDGQVITYDASGDPVAVGPGTDGQVLTSTGAGSPPAFEAVPSFNADAAQVFNDSGADVDFRIESNNEANMFFVDASTDCVGIGTSTPRELSGLAGNTLTVEEKGAGTPASIEIIGNRVNGAGQDVGMLNFVNSCASSANHIAMAAIWAQDQDGAGKGHLTFRTTDGSLTERMRIGHNGKIGINTSTMTDSLFTVYNTDVNNGGVGIKMNQSGDAWALIMDNAKSGDHDVGVIWRNQGNNKWFLVTGSVGGNTLHFKDEEGDHGMYLAQDTNSWVSGTSDERRKTDWVNFTDALDKINTLTKVGNYKSIDPVTGEYKNEEHILTGLSAQEIQGIIPSAVEGLRRSEEFFPDDDTEYLTLKYQDVFVLGIKAIQELSAKNDALETKVAALETKVATLEAVENDSSSSNAALEARIIALEAA